MEEYIERNAIIEALKRECPNLYYASEHELIRTFPAVDVAPVVHGKWIGKKYNWDNRYLPTYNVNIEYIHTWKMEKILKELDGTQFAQFCRDMEIPNTCNKMRGV